MSWLTDILSIGGLGSSALAPLGKGLTSKEVRDNLALQSEKLYTQVWQQQAWIGDPILRGGSARHYQGVPEKKMAKKPTKCPNCYSNSRDTFKLNEDSNYECTYCGSVY